MPYMISKDFNVDRRIDFSERHDSWCNACQVSPIGTPPPPLGEPVVGYIEKTPGRSAPQPVKGNGRLLFVSADVKDIIERLEPGIHDFAPMELRYGTPDAYEPFEYYVLRINQAIDPADRDKSDMTIVTQPNGNRVWFKKPAIPLVIRPEAVRGKHLWIHQHPFCSDELHDTLVDNGLTYGWEFEKQLDAQQ